jgi:hypothetical protein
MALSKVDQPVTALPREDPCSETLVALVGWDHDQEPSSFQVFGRDDKLFVFIPQMLDKAVNTPAKPMMTTGHVEALGSQGASQNEDVASLKARPNKIIDCRGNLVWVIHQGADPVRRIGDKTFRKVGKAGFLVSTFARDFLLGWL